jgi:hypothetical protein
MRRTEKGEDREGGGPGRRRTRKRKTWKGEDREGKDKEEAIDCKRV